MLSLQIRELPEDIYEALAERARREGRSLEQQAVADLRRIADADAADRRRLMLETLDQPADQARPALPDPVQLVREHRDA